MSAVLKRVDPTAGLELATGDEIALEATRWVFFAGDTIDPTRKDDLPHLAEGGEEMHNHCLRRTSGFLPRCTITPLEVWAEWLPLEFFPEGVLPLRLKGMVTDDANPNGLTFIGKTLFGYAHYPGNLIVDALGLEGRERKGVVEVEVLRGVDSQDKAAQEIQDLFFPPDFAKPIQLRLVEERINKVLGENTNTDVKSVGRDMLKSCDLFRRWALSYIDKCHTQLDQRQSHQHVYSYSPKIRLLLDQLEIEPRNAQYNPVDSILKAMSAQGLTADVIAQMAERDENLIAKLSQAFSDSMAAAIKSIKSE